ncbi:ABC transporter substrate-binding protein [Fundidesulfovibrio butyratiphilus]
MKRVFAAFLAVAGWLAFGSGSVLAAETIKIAVPAPFTGAMASYGQFLKNGVELKLEEVNAKGGINGRKVEAVYLDEQCEPREAATVSAKIAMDKDIVGVVGHLCSSAHLAALPAYVRAGIPVVSHGATSMPITGKGIDQSGKNWAFRVIYRDDVQGEYLAQYVAKVLRLKKVAVFYELNDYGLGLKGSFAKKARELGLDVVAEEAYTKSAQDFTPQLTKIKAAGPQALFIAGYYVESAQIAAQSKKIGMNIPFLGADGIDNPDYIRLAGAAGENTYVTTPFLAQSAGPAAKAFIAAFTARHKRDVDWFAANAYDAAGVLLEAVAKVGPDRAKVRDYLASLDSKEKGYQGVTGVIFFDAGGDTKKPAYVKVVKDGAFIAAPKQME